MQQTEEACSDLKFIRRLPAAANHFSGKGEEFMGSNTVKSIITGVILLILVVAAIKFTFKVLLPIAIVVIAAYIVYMLITGKKIR